MPKTSPKSYVNLHRVIYGCKSMTKNVS
jgi:hypothetical protein